MLIFKDIITGDEILSDVHPIKEVDGVIYECDCSMVNKGGELNIDIGANASAEEPDEPLDNSEQTEKVIDIVHAFQLEKTTFDKKSYGSYIKAYLKRVKEELQNKEVPAEEITAFEKGAMTFVKKVLGNFKDYDFYTSSSMNPDGMIILLNYRDDGITPYISVWKHGLTEMKV
ncbi:hypothetical protein K3495_g7126 [Podosphaera aphanis]|nr:hypothetical protein K3495_g7126 [Podosphaera aphanis]